MPIRREIERALEQLELTEEVILFRLGPFELHRKRRVARSQRHTRRWLWVRWVSLLGLLAIFASGFMRLVL